MVFQWFQKALLWSKGLKNRNCPKMKRSQKFSSAAVLIAASSMKYNLASDGK